MEKDGICVEMYVTYITNALPFERMTIYIPRTMEAMVATPKALLFTDVVPSPRLRQTRQRFVFLFATSVIAFRTLNSSQHQMVNAIASM